MPPEIRNCLILYITHNIQRTEMAILGKGAQINWIGDIKANHSLKRD